MSIEIPRAKALTVPEIAARKGGEPIVCLTAYTAPMARYLDPHVDILLVGDSVGMVLYGLPNTLSVSLDTMIAHGAAVVRGRTQALVAVDLPFGSYQSSHRDAYKAAVRVISETGCEAVKLEGGIEMADTVAFLSDRGAKSFVPSPGGSTIVRLAMPEPLRDCSRRARWRPATFSSVTMTTFFRPNWAARMCPARSRISGPMRTS